MTLSSGPQVGEGRRDGSSSLRPGTGTAEVEQRWGNTAGSAQEGGEREPRGERGKGRAGKRAGEAGEHGRERGGTEGSLSLQSGAGLGGAAHEMEGAARSGPERRSPSGTAAAPGAAGTRAAAGPARSGGTAPHGPPQRAALPRPEPSSGPPPFLLPLTYAERGPAVPPPISRCRWERWRRPLPARPPSAALRRPAGQAGQVRPHALTPSGPREPRHGPPPRPRAAALSPPRCAAGRGDAAPSPNPPHAGGGDAGMLRHCPPWRTARRCSLQARFFFFFSGFFFSFLFFSLPLFLD